MLDGAGIKVTSTSRLRLSIVLPYRMDGLRRGEYSLGLSSHSPQFHLLVALYFMYNNFCRVHQTLRVTPAMEAGLTDHVWSLEELVGLLDQKTAKVAA
jgi:hypothetical protein